jgi:hypothetical protein
MAVYCDKQMKYVNLPLGKNGSDFNDREGP